MSTYVILPATGVLECNTHHLHADIYMMGKETYTHLVSCKQTVKSSVTISFCLCDWKVVCVCLCSSVRPGLWHFQLHVHLHAGVKVTMCNTWREFKFKTFLKMN